MPKYEKVDAHTIRVIKEQATDVALANLLAHRTKMTEDIKFLTESLKNLEVVIAEAKKLGITPKPEKEIEFPKGVLSEKLEKENKNG